MTINELEKKLKNYKDEPVVGQWQDYAGDSKSTEVEYIWFATDGYGNEMGTFVLESDARQFAMKYGYTVGWWIKDRDDD